MQFVSFNSSKFLIARGNDDINLKGTILTSSQKKRLGVELVEKRMSKVENIN